MGTAFLLAEHYQSAQRALHAAEIHSGSSTAIERNMLLARKGGDANHDALLPWYRLPLFWHFGTPLRIRIALALFAISAAWMVGLLRLLGWRRSMREALAVVVVVVVVLGTSVLASLHELNRVRSDLTRLNYQEPTGQEVDS